MSTPTVTYQAFPEQISGSGDPVIYTAGSTDEFVAVDIYITLSPIGTSGAGIPILAYTDEFGVRSIPLMELGPSNVMSVRKAIRIKAGTTISVTETPSGQTVWSMYTAVEVLSTI